MKGYEENMGILNELYGGSIEINDRAVLRNGEYYRTVIEAGSCEKILVERLSTEDRAVFQRYADLCLDASTIYARDEFAFGFRLGAKLLIDVLTGRSDNFQEKG